MTYKCTYCSRHGKLWRKYGKTTVKELFCDHCVCSKFIKILGQQFAAEDLMQHCHNFRIKIENIDVNVDVRILKLEITNEWRSIMNEAINIGFVPAVPIDEKSDLWEFYSFPRLLITSLFVGWLKDNTIFSNLRLLK